MNKSVFRLLAGLALVCLLWAGTSVQAEQKVEIPESTTVTVVKQGEGERALLRYRFTKGSIFQTRSSMKMAMEIKIGGLSDGPVDMPTSITDETSRITDVLEDGTAKVESEITRVSVQNDGKLPAAARGEYRRLMQTMVGLKISYRIDPLGEISEVVIRAPEGLDPAIAQTVDLMRQTVEAGAIRLPKEPVAVGSVWSEVMPVESNGLKIRQETRYTLRSRDRGRLSLDVVVQQQAPRQTVRLMGLDITYTKLASQGRGSIQTDLVGPQSSTRMETSTNAEYEFGHEGENDQVRNEHDFGALDGPGCRAGVTCGYPKRSRRLGRQLPGSLCTLHYVASRVYV